MPDSAPLESAPLPFAWDDSLRFAERPPAAAQSRWQRGLVGIGVVALHVLFGWLIELQSRPTAPPEHDDIVVVVDYIETLPTEVIRAPAVDTLPFASDAAGERTIVRTPRAEPIRNLPPRPIDSVATTSKPEPLQLFRPDGSIALPDKVVDDLKHNAGDDREFAFQVPDLERAGHWLDRPPALVYEATRFDKYWQPSETLLDKVLRKAVEKTTKEIRIPIPGAPGRELVCVVSILAAGGACGVERYGSDIPRPGIDDPATLDANEAVACQKWWDRIVGATKQDEWHRTRKLYDEECRKPLAKGLPPTPKPEAELPPAAQ